MDDAISRQKAINTVHRMCEIWDTGDIDDLEEMIVTALAELCPEKRTETHTCEDAENEAIHMRKYVFASALNTIRGNLRTFPTIEPEPQIIYSKAGYIMSLHKEYGCTLTRAEEAHNKALEYLRDKAMMKG